MHITVTQEVTTREVSDTKGTSVSFLHFLEIFLPMKTNLQLSPDCDLKNSGDTVSPFTIFLREIASFSSSSLISHKME